ncbi:LLM class flavin-dependent oxidoreductase [Scytonema sp. NUACC26]|uniref:LLM class flavin-dependent oxidoreductase n=1 Tax=Scytonema sp. NUACC26 TaxID=3140176 RepID=UPI0038B2445D
MQHGHTNEETHHLRPYADVLREDREAVVLADRLGYREAFIGEHLVDSAETISSSLAFIAHLADACPSITFGTGVLPLANYHPVMAAAQVAMVDHLVHGRLVLGVGPGVRGDAEAIGDLGSDRNDPAGWTRAARCRISRLDRNLGDLRGCIRRPRADPELPGRPTLGGPLRRSLWVARGAQRLRGR